MNIFNYLRAKLVHNFNLVFLISITSIIIYLISSNYVYENAKYEVINQIPYAIDSEEDLVLIDKDLTALSTETEIIALKSENIAVLDSYVKDILSSQGLQFQLISAIDRISYISDDGGYPFLAKLKEIDSIQNSAISSIIESEISSINENMELIFMDFATDKITQEEYENNSCIEISKLELLNNYKRSIATRYVVEGDQKISEYVNNISTYLKIKTDVENDYINNKIDKEAYDSKIKSLDSKIDYYNNLIISVGN